MPKRLVPVLAARWLFAGLGKQDGRSGTGTPQAGRMTARSGAKKAGLPGKTGAVFSVGRGVVQDALIRFARWPGAV